MSMPELEMDCNKVKWSKGSNALQLSKFRISIGLHKHEWQHPCLSRHPGNWKTSFLIAQSPLTSSKKSSGRQCLAIECASFFVAWVPKAALCLAEGQVQLAK